MAVSTLVAGFLIELTVKVYLDMSGNKYFGFGCKYFETKRPFTMVDLEDLGDLDDFGDLELLDFSSSHFW